MVQAVSFSPFAGSAKRPFFISPVCDDRGIIPGRYSGRGPVDPGFKGRLRRLKYRHSGGRLFFYCFLVCSHCIIKANMKKEQLKTEYMHQRIEPKLKKQFIEAAKADSRTMAGALVVAMKDYIEKMKGKSP